MAESKITTRSGWAGWIGSASLVLAVIITGGALAAWKYASLEQADAASLNQPEPMESITTAITREGEHRPTTTSIGTTLALRSITLRNELAGTIREVNLVPGQVVEAGALLVALDVSVERAELQAQEAKAALAQTQLARVERAGQNNAISAIEMDRALADRDIALAETARFKAIIDRKTILAPFRARVGLADVHVGQYLAEGTELTTLQGIEDPPAVHVDFTVTQHVASGLREGDLVEVVTTGGGAASEATIVAIDARVDATTRNAMVRARIEGVAHMPAPGASVRVRVPAGPTLIAALIPVNALRKSPAGDHVFVITPDQDGQRRAHMRSVVAGAMLGDEVLVIQGLAPGEDVASSGSFKLREGVLVAVTEPAGTEQPGPDGPPSHK